MLLQVQANNTESARLVGLRDAPLPRLTSGGPPIANIAVAG